MKTRFALLGLVLAWSGMALGDAVSIGNGRLKFTPPEAPWKFSNTADHGTAAVYRTPHGVILFAYVANKAPKPEQEEQLRSEVLKALTASVRRNNTEIVSEPKIESDGRFFLVISEQFRKEGKLTTQWHIYRNLPPHQVVATVLVMSEDAKEIQEAKDAAMALASSAELVGPGEKAPPEAGGGKHQAEPAMEKMTPEVEAAQEKLKAAMAKCEEKLAKDPKYTAAKKVADDAEAKLKALRAADPPDRAAIASASLAWISAKGEVERIRKQAMNQDPAVIEARQALEAARSGK